MRSLPCDARFIKWDNASQAWVATTYSAGLGWANGAITLNPGEGAFLCTCCPRPFKIAFNGYPHVPVLPIPLPACRMLSRQTNAPGTYEDIVGASPNDGTTVYRFMNCAWTAYAYDASSDSWTPTTPVAAVGEAVFISPPSSPCPSVLPVVPCRTINIYIDSAGVRLTFPTEANHRYTIDCTDVLSVHPTRTVLKVMDGDGAMHEVVDPDPLHDARFYRVPVYCPN